MSSKKVVHGPIANQGQHGPQFVIARSAGCGGDQLSIFHETSHLNSLALQAGEIAAVAKILSQRFNGGERLFGQLAFFEGRPGREDVAALFDTNAVAEIVAENHVKAREQNGHEKFSQAREAWWDAGNGQTVLNIAEDKELVIGAAFVKIYQAGSPIW